MWDTVLALIAFVLSIIELARSKLESLLAWAVLCLALIYILHRINNG